jgi:hypothetical protein
MPLLRPTLGLSEGSPLIDEAGLLTNRSKKGQRVGATISVAITMYEISSHRASHE